MLLLWKPDVMGGRDDCREGSSQGQLHKVREEMKKAGECCQLAEELLDKMSVYALD